MYVLPCVFAALLLVFVLYDTVVRIRNQKLVVSAAKASEIVSTMFPEAVKDQLLDETKTNRKAKGKKHALVAERYDNVIAELYPDTTCIFADIAGFTAWASSRQPQQVSSMSG